MALVMVKAGEQTPPPVPIEIEPGFYDDMDAERYHLIEAASKSLLVRIDRSPAHAKTPFTPTTAMDVGSGSHTAVFEPEKFDAEYKILSDGERATPKIKKEAEEQGKTVLRHNDAIKVKGIARAVRNHPDSAPILMAEGVAERSWFWRHPVYGVLCKCRTDWYVGAHEILVDLKTTTDARMNPFSRIAGNKKYHWQAAHSLDGVSSVTKKGHTLFCFIVVEVEPPHGVNVFFAKQEIIELGRTQIHHVVNVYAECLRTGEWPCISHGYPQGIVQDLDLPQWDKPY